MLNLSQNDPRWKDKKMNKSKYTIGSNGCTCTALCDLWSKFYYRPKQREYLRPDEIVHEIDLVPITGDSDPRYIAWASIKNIGMKFIWRQWGYKANNDMRDPVTNEYITQEECMKKYMKHKDYGVLIRVKTSSGGQHWLAGVSKSIFGFSSNNPWNGVRLWRTPKPYPEIDGFCIVQKFDN